MFSKIAYENSHWFGYVKLHNYSLMPDYIFSCAKSVDDFQHGV